MLALKFLTAPTNPLEIVLKDLEDEPVPVTFIYLDWVRSLLDIYGVETDDYNLVLDFLFFMEDNGLVRLDKNDESGTYTIAKTYSYGS